MRKILLSIILFLPLFIKAQQSITVLDENKAPLPYAHVLFSPLNNQSTSKIVLTDLNGEAFLNENISLIIEIKHIGYVTEVDTIPPSITKTYQLEQDQLGEIVVTAQYAPTKPEDAVQKIKIIDRKRIESQGAVNLRDVLQNETNIRISQDNVLGSGISMQGISGQNIKILIDGVPVIGRLNGNVDISQINLNNIEKIEIVEGPLSVNYGTDALAGTINLISKKEQKSTYSSSVNSYYETVGQYNVDGRIGWHSKKSNLSLSGGRNYFDGWSPNDPFIQFPESKLADTNRIQQWNMKEQYFADIQYSYNLKGHVIRPYTSYFSEKITNRGYPRTPPYYDTAFDDYYKTWRKNGGVDISGYLSDNHNYTVLASINDFKRIKNTYIKDLTTLEENLVTDKSYQDTSKFNLWMSRGNISSSKDSAKLNYQVGYDINYETASGKRIADGDKQQGDYALFTSAEYTPISKITIRPGVRFAHNTQYEAPITPSVNVKYDLGKFSTRVSYARGFRAPTLKELYFEFVDVNHNIIGNKELKAEQSHNYHVNIDWKTNKRSTTLKVDVGGYYNEMDNLITIAQSATNNLEYLYVNIGDYKTIGFQGNGNLAYEHLNVGVGITYMGRYNTLSKVESIPTYNYSPEVKANLMYEFYKQNMSVGLFYKYTGELQGFTYDGSGEVVERFTEDYQTLDLTLTKYFYAKKIKWSLGAKNIFDVQNLATSANSGGVHASSTGSIAQSWGRSFFTSLQINLDWK